MRRSRRVLLMLRSPGKIRVDYLILAILFFLGILVGHIAGSSLNDMQKKELVDYLSGYAGTAASRQSVSLLLVAFSYFRSASALFLMGLAVCGIWLVPLFMAGQGFFLGYSVHCFGMALGRDGILIALACLGVRCLFVLPCSFYLAARSWSSAARLRKNGQVRERTDDGRSAVYPVIVCGVILLIGCIFEISVVPRLMSLAFGRIS